MLVLLLSCVCFLVVFLRTDRSRKYRALGEPRGPAPSLTRPSALWLSESNKLNKTGFPVPSSSKPSETVLQT